jgi:serine/threonine protein kinase
MNRSDWPSSGARLDFLLPPQRPDEMGRLAHYRVLKVLGQGGMGVVFLAEDTRLGRTVALKTMKPEIAADPRHRQRFLREARAAAKVEDDHIVPIYDVGEERGVPWLAMPLLKGQSLDEMLKRLKVLTPAQAVRLGAQVARGLAAAHAAGLIHRDVKPANVWVEPEGGGRAKLLDFGLAREERPDPDGTEPLTRTGAVVGTPAYMAPEQARGEKLDARADLFSLGCVLYRAVTGRLPFQGDGLMGTLLALATETPPPPHEVNSAVPPPLSALIVKLLAKERTGRPASASEVVTALQALLQETATATLPLAKPVAVPAAAPKDENPWSDLTEVQERPAPAAPAAPPTPPWNRRRLAIGAAAALVLIGGLLAGVIVIIKNKKGEEVARVVAPEGGSVETRKVSDSGKAKIDPASVDVDRRAAEWVLSIGGKVFVNYDWKWVTELPKGQFGLAGVNLSDNRKVTDAGLANLKECRGIWQLDLGGSSISDAGLAQVKDFASARLMTELYLSNTAVGDAGLAHLSDCTGLRQIQMGNTRVTDSGLAHLVKLKNLRVLWVNMTKVTEAGVKKLAAALPLCKILWDGGVIAPPDFAEREAAEWVLSIGGRLSIRQGKQESEIKAIKDLPATPFEVVGVDFVEVVGGKFVGNQIIDDAGLERLKGLNKLQHLNLSHTRVGDAGLEHITGLSNLTFLGLGACWRVGDAGLARLGKAFPNLSTLYLGGTQVSDAGLVHLKQLTKLTRLTINVTRVSDTGLGHIKALTKLESLDLSKTQVSDTGLKLLTGLSNLTELYLIDTPITTDGIAALQKALPKCKIVSGPTAK